MIKPIDKIFFMSKIFMFPLNRSLKCFNYDKLKSLMFIGIVLIFSIFFSVLSQGFPIAYMELNFDRIIMFGDILLKFIICTVIHSKNCLSVNNMHSMIVKIKKIDSGHLLDIFNVNSIAHSSRTVMFVSLNFYISVNAFIYYYKGMPRDTLWTDILRIAHFLLLASHIFFNFNFYFNVEIYLTFSSFLTLQLDYLNEKIKCSNRSMMINIGLVEYFIRLNGKIHEIIILFKVTFSKQLFVIIVYCGILLILHTFFLYTMTQGNLTSLSLFKTVILNTIFYTMALFSVAVYSENIEYQVTIQYFFISIIY